jgi:gliding motility-associated-like protein
MKVIRRKFIYTLLMLASKFCTAQINLVYNGDFELYDTCPANVSSPFDYEIRKCLGWTAPTYGTSDYYNACAVSPFVDVPSNGVGYQTAYSGNGYCGFGALALTGGSGDNYTGPMWWEYVQGRFVQPLEAGHIYSISFRVSLAEVSKYAITRIGAYISETPVSGTTTEPLPFLPQVESPAGVYLTDSIGWTLIQGYYMAQGGEQYITIGNYHDMFATDTLRLLVPDFADPYSYYYLEVGDIVDRTDSLVTTVFTPNGDGINDAFILPLSAGDQLYIYNRWGNEVAQLNSDNPAWDGTANGSACTAGVYYYVWRRNTAATNQYLRKGFFQLIR